MKPMMAINKKFAFNTHFCPNCRSCSSYSSSSSYNNNNNTKNNKNGDDILEYIASYNGVLHEDGYNDVYDSGQTWYNNINLYQCIKCKYYIMLNIKRQTIYNTRHGYRRVNPFCDENTYHFNKHRNTIDTLDTGQLNKKYSKSEDKCNQCKDNMLLLDSDFAGSITGATRRNEYCYCINCCLFYDTMQYSS